MSDRYKIVRFFQNSHRSYTLFTGMTLEEAKKHCESKETSWATATSKAAKARTRKNGPWFDGYHKE